MAFRLRSKTNTAAPDGEFPYGNIQDNDGTGNGTPVNKAVYADIHQFFARMMEKAIENDQNGFDWNEQPDSEYDGFQYFEALLKTKPYLVYVATISQSGTAAPTVVVLENTIGNIVWSYTGVGQYTGTLAGKFTANKTWVMLGGPAAGTGALNAYATSAGINTIDITVENSASSGINSALVQNSIEIRVYP